MSTRTIVEINHDHLRMLREPDFLQKLELVICGGGKWIDDMRESLKPCVRVLGQRHHSEPEWKQGSDR